MKNQKTSQIISTTLVVILYIWLLFFVGKTYGDKYYKLIEEAKETKEIVTELIEKDELDKANKILVNTCFDFGEDYLNEQVPRNVESKVEDLYSTCSAYASTGNLNLETKFTEYALEDIDDIINTEVDSVQLFIFDSFRKNTSWGFIILYSLFLLSIALPFILQIPRRNKYLIIKKDSLQKFTHESQRSVLQFLNITRVYGFLLPFIFTVFELTSAYTVNYSILSPLFWIYVAVNTILTIVNYSQVKKQTDKKHSKYSAEVDQLISTTKDEYISVADLQQHAIKFKPKVNLNGVLLFISFIFQIALLIFYPLIKHILR